MDNNYNDFVKKLENESYVDYADRLFRNRKDYGISNDNICRILNEEFKNDYSSDKYRKDYYKRCGHVPQTSLVKNRILCISDLHIPYQIDINTFSNYACKTDILVLNGDILDCQSISSFNKKYRISIVEEMVQARNYIINLIELIKPKKVVITKGNHEARMLRYLSDKLNDDILSIMPDSPLDLIINDGFYDNDRFNHTKIQYEHLKKVYDGKIDIIYNGDWYATIGNVIFVHPLTYSSPILKTTEKAVNYFVHNKDTKNCTAIIMSHTHKIGFYVMGDILMYEQGCCCRVEDMDYLDGKLTMPQQKGYMYICLDADGNIIEDKTKLIHLKNN